MKLIVGLGNPGKEYAANRHNIGFICLSHFARLNSISLDKKQSQARVGLGVIAGEQVLLARPQTYMNLSGVAVSQLMHRHNIGLEDLIVIHDDLDLPLGKIRIRRGGSAAGHNGIKSIIASLGTPEFIRVRIGISRPQNDGEPARETIVDYVLGDFDPVDRSTIDDTVKRVGEALLSLLTTGLDSAMNKFN